MFKANKTTFQNNTTSSSATSDLSAKIDALEARNRYLSELQRQYTQGKVILEFNLADFDLSDDSTGNLDEAEKKAYLKEKAQQKLSGNTFFNLLVAAHGKKQELLEDLVVAGQLPASLITGKGAKKRSEASPNLLSTNEQLNLKAKRTNPLLGKLAASPWLLVMGICLLLFWGGLPLLFFVTGGALGGRERIEPTVMPNGTKRSEPTTVKTVTATPTKTYIVGSKSTEDGNAQENTYDGFRFSFASAKTQEISSQEPQQDLASPNILAASPTVTTTLRTTTTPAAWRTPNPKGGLNGPHGAFFAPSRLRIEALELDVPIIKAVTQLEAAPDITNSASNTAAQTQLLRVNWPRPGEVVHLGAFAGENGNTIILANQANLSVLRRIQLNDTLTLFDRLGNGFVYRVIPFGATGGAERVVDPALESWIFATPTAQNLALLTVVVNFPQPLPPVNPNTNVQSGLEASQAEKSARDDYINPYKLAYRAVLAFYVPAKAETNATGTPVVVPDDVYEVRPPLPALTPPVAVPTPNNSAASSSPALSSSPDNPSASPSVPATRNPIPSPTPLPTGTVVIPGGLPNTGKGGGQPTANPKIR